MQSVDGLNSFLEIVGGIYFQKHIMVMSLNPSWKLTPEEGCFCVSDQGYLNCKYELISLVELSALSEW